jgi:hypothetical protein
VRIENPRFLAEVQADSVGREFNGALVPKNDCSSGWRIPSRKERILELLAAVCAVRPAFFEPVDHVGLGGGRSPRKYSALSRCSFAANQAGRSDF